MSSQSFPRSVRLRRPAEFTRVYRDGRRIAAGYLQLCYAPVEGAEARLGLAIAKRVLPRAVDRNQAKRLIRESFRHRQAVLPPIDIVISLRGGKRASLPDDFHTTLEKLWLRLARR